MSYRILAAPVNFIVTFNGNPAGGAKLYIFPNDSVMHCPNDVELYARRTTDPMGVVALDMPEGTWDLLILLTNLDPAACEGDYYGTFTVGNEALDIVVDVIENPATPPIDEPIEEPAPPVEEPYIPPEEPAPYEPPYVEEPYVPTDPIPGAGDPADPIPADEGPACPAGYTYDPVSDICVANPPSNVLPIALAGLLGLILLRR